MPHVSYLDYADVDEELQAVMREYDVELGGSEFVRVFARAPRCSSRSSSSTFR
jgi:hypothetical protein